MLSFNIVLKLTIRPIRLRYAGIETRKADFCDAVMKATDGHGADLAHNTVGGTVFAECIKARSEPTPRYQASFTPARPSAERSGPSVQAMGRCSSSASAR